MSGSGTGWEEFLVGDCGCTSRCFGSKLKSLGLGWVGFVLFGLVLGWLWFVLVGLCICEFVFVE